MKESIFTGKCAKNNELILKVLYEKGCLLPKVLANEMADRVSKNKVEKAKNAKKFYSLLVRKDGRLEDLVKKEFLEKIEKGYSLTFNKGVYSALALFEENKIPKSAINFFSKNEEIDAIAPRDSQLLSNLDPEMFKLFFKTFRCVTFNLLDKGLKFEKLTNEEFNSYSAEETCRFDPQSINENGEKTAPTELSPEFNEALYRIFKGTLNKAKEITPSLTKKASAVFSELDRELDKLYPPEEEKHDEL